MKTDTETLIDAIYDGIVEMPGWRTFLDRTRDRLGVAVASILIESNSLGRPEHLRLFSTGAAPAVCDRIERFSAAAVFPEEAAVAVRSTPDGASLNVTGALPAGIAFTLGFWRVGAGSFTETDIALGESFVPHLTRAMRIFVQYAQAYRERMVYQTVVDRIGVGVVLVDAQSMIMAENGIGAEILASRDGLSADIGRLSSAIPALEQHIRAAAAAQTMPAQEPGRPLAIERADNPSPLTLIVHPGPSVEHGSAPLRRSAIVMLRDPDRRASVSAHVVGQLFGLTPAEAALATLIAQGSDLDEAAETLGIRRNTARSQLQSIFMKTNAKRQSELVRMILSSVATLSN
jgi:DNA-binding CsgD family transcriptional regulator